MAEPYRIALQISVRTVWLMSLFMKKNMESERNMIPIINLEETGKNIKLYRQQRDLSVSDIQKMMGFTNPQAIYKWQNGQSLPSIDNFIILSAILGVKISDILVVDYV